MQAAPFVPQHTQSISFCQNIIMRCPVEKMTMPSCPPKRPRLHLSAHADIILRGRYLTKKVAGTIVETPAQLRWRVATDSARAERLDPTRRRQQSFTKPSISRS